MKALATALLALALLPATAAAKTGLMLESTPDGLTAGQSWDARFQFVRNDAIVEPMGGKVPLVRITSVDTGASQTFPARKQHNGMWAARVVFPRPGEWRYAVEGFPTTRDRQVFESVVVAPRPDAPAQNPPIVAASAGGGSSFPYGWVGAGAALVLVGGAVLLLRRLRSEN